MHRILLKLFLLHVCIVLECPDFMDKNAERSSTVLPFPNRQISALISHPYCRVGFLWEHIEPTIKFVGETLLNGRRHRSDGRQKFPSSSTRFEVWKKMF
jgi:hypothetical protein